MANDDGHLATGHYNQATTWSTRIVALRFDEYMGLVFADGFESGDSDAWSNTSP